MIVGILWGVYRRLLEVKRGLKPPLGRPLLLVAGTPAFLPRLALPQPVQCPPPYIHPLLNTRGGSQELAHSLGQQDFSTFFSDRLLTDINISCSPRPVAHTIENQDLRHRPHQKRRFSPPLLSMVVLPKQCRISFSQKEIIFIYWIYKDISNDGYIF